MQKLIVQSHRGGGALTPENTLESFDATWQMGAVPEADLRTTRDGVIVAFHDANFARVVKNPPPELHDQGVQDVSWETLSRLDVGQAHNRAFAPQRVCRVEEIFAALQARADWALYLDIKDVELPQLASLALRFGVAERVILAAPREQILREWMELVPTGQTLLWMGIRKNGDHNTLNNRLETLQSENFAGLTQLQIHVEASRNGDSWQFKPTLDFLSEVAPLLRAANVLFQTFPWDCDQPAVYRALLNVGVQSFASDYPEVALAVLHERNQAAPDNVPDNVSASEL